jgi:hypothetical protein
MNGRKNWLMDFFDHSFVPHGGLGINLKHVWAS